jgi:7,8-dihydropterin-6-yl-methyl-4-(beta-D-ribofuranosyl)aminobenzene 5'-phosphate synthase
MAIRTPNGLLVVDGCSHAGVEKILEAATTTDPHVHILFGGLHMVKTPDPEIERIATALHDKWKLDRIAPGHCTGEPAFAALQKTFGKDYLYAGVGTVVELQGSSHFPKIRVGFVSIAPVPRQRLLGRRGLKTGDARPATSLQSEPTTW